MPCSKRSRKDCVWFWGSGVRGGASAIEEAFERGVNYLYWGTVRQPEFSRAMVNLSKTHRDELILTIQSLHGDAVEAPARPCGALISRRSLA